MQFIETKNWISDRRIVAALLCGVLLVGAAIAGEQESARELVRLVGVDVASERHEAPRLFASIASNSQFKPVASQAMALIQIRQGNYSDAWKLLSVPSSVLGSASNSYRIGHEKLILWLGLEAESSTVAEKQLKRLVVIANHKELPEDDRKELSFFLGGVVGMLQSAGNTTCVSASTLEASRASLDAVESNVAVEEFHVGWEASQLWSIEFRLRIRECTDAGPEKGLEILQSLQKELALAKELSAKQMKDIDQKKQIELKRRNLIKQHMALINEFSDTSSKPTLGREPKPPSEPDGEPSKEERRMKTVYNQRMKDFNSRKKTMSRIWSDGRYRKRPDMQS